MNVVKMLEDPRTIAILTTIVLLTLRLLIVNYPSPSLPPDQCIDQPKSECGFIFDEYYYVPAARKLMAGEAVNNEHPPLSKMMIVMGIKLFGDNPLGWRFFPMLLSSMAVGFLVMLAWHLTRRYLVVWVASLLLGADMMLFNVGSIAVLDGPALFFTALAALLYIRSRFTSSALILSLAILAKTSSLFTYLGLLLYSLITGYGEKHSWREALQNLLHIFERTSIPAMAIVLAGLAAYDLSLGAYSNPFAHLDYILTYHSQLRYSCVEYNLPFRCVDRSGTVVDLPFSWISPILQFQPMPFNVQTVSDGFRSWHPIAFWGIYSPYWWTTLVVVPVMLYQMIAGLRAGRTVTIEAFVISWLASNYGIYYIIGYLFSRWVYPFYFITALPALVIGLATMLENGAFSRSVLFALVAAQMIWAFIYFPVRSELHLEILRILNLPS
jgi:4-amino-4-deoxy-L-arabinose transferase-like glycosyltransferase